MSSRETILASIRQAKPPATDLPTLDGDWIEYENLTQQFGEVLRSVGGELLVADTLDDAIHQIRELPVCQQASLICSLAEGLGLPGKELAMVADPKELDSIDVAIVRGAFCVAENGAVWVPVDRAIQQALLFICQHLVLVVPSAQLVPHMHAAYERLANDSVQGPRFATFISGPSKTADIEQSLVIGAQGARSLTVVLVADDC